MRNKLPLEDFLNKLECDMSNKLEESNSKFIMQEFTIPLASFYSSLEEHKGFFYINEVKYDHLLASSANLYFYNMLNESISNQFLIFYDPILDIKQKEGNKYTIFYYPDTIFSIRLENTNGQEI